MVEHRVPWLDPLFIGLSIVGYAGLVWIALAPLLSRWGRRPVAATTAMTAAAVWTADLLATAFKVAVDRPRPFERLAEPEPLLGGTVGASFPSGHAATSFAGAVVLALLARRAVPALFLLAALVAFSRIYVGVHYPLDVLAGAVLGAAVALALVFAVRLPRWPSAGRRRSGEPRPSG